MITYFPIHFTKGTDGKVTFSHLSFKPTLKYFDEILYFSINSIFCLLGQLSISYASWLNSFEKVLSHTFYYGNWCWSHIFTHSVHIYPKIFWLSFCTSRWVLQSCCTFNLNSMVVSYWQIQLKQFCHTFSIHFYTFSIVKCLIFNFSWNLLHGLKNSFQRKDRALHALQLVCNIKFTFYNGIILKNLIEIFSLTFPIHFSTFSIVKVVIFKFTRNLMHGYENGFQQKDIALRALQLRCTSNLNPMVSSFWKIQLKYVSHTFPIHFYPFSIVKSLMFNFSRNLLNGFENGLKWKDRAHRALQVWCTSHLTSMVTLSWKIQLKVCSYTFPIHSITIFIVKGFIFKFALNLLNGY